MINKIRWYLNVLCCGLQLDPRGIYRRGRSFPAFYRDLQTFKKNCDWPIQVEPRLGDNDAPAGALGEYFWQDLFVAKRVIELSPARHIDIGSRIDGFVAHLACTRTIEVIDIRPLAEKIPGVSFHQVDITNLPENWVSAADCVTCLHSIEHFGLGRYGDALDAGGWKSGLRNLARIVRPGGTLILSTPVGHQRVKFNSHRIFHPATIAGFGASIGLQVSQFFHHTYDSPPDSPITRSSDLEKDFSRLASMKYGLGIFEFKKG